jgi:hypothetical protein
MAADRPEVQHALRHAGCLPVNPVDNLEWCLDDTLATLHSRKVRHTVAALAVAHDTTIANGRTDTSNG